ncbi:MAG: general stress protein [Planctomycetia bacterium]|nr:general stress protein [Planctomycetia bacterium]
MSIANSVVAVFESHDQAEAAIRTLRENGFDMKNLSIAGKDCHKEGHAVGDYTTGDRMWHSGKLGAFWGGFWGLFLGSAFFWVPGIGQLLVAGPLVMWIFGALDEAAVVDRLNALGAALHRIGIPKSSVVRYETEVKNGKLLLVAHGTPEDVERAQEILHQTQAQTSTVHAEVFAVCM